MTQQQAIQDLAQLVRQLSDVLKQIIINPDYEHLQRELSEISRKARDIDLEVGDA